MVAGGDAEITLWESPPVEKRNGSDHFIVRNYDGMKNPPVGDVAIYLPWEEHNGALYTVYKALNEQQVRTAVKKYFMLGYRVQERRYSGAWVMHEHAGGKRK